MVKMSMFRACLANLMAPSRHLQSRSRRRGTYRATALLAVFAALGACQFADDEQTVIEEDYRRQRYDANYGTSIFGGDGLSNLLDSGGSSSEGGGGAGIGVNSFLWRASLDTISFMPLSSADPFGGVIITDWYAPPQSPGERFKMTVYILDRTLRADGLKVAVFRQQRATSGGDWVDSPISPQTVVSLENKILERARQMRSTATGS